MSSAMATTTVASHVDGSGCSGKGSAVATTSLRPKSLESTNATDGSNGSAVQPQGESLKWEKKRLQKLQRKQRQKERKRNKRAEATLSTTLPSLAPPSLNQTAKRPHPNGESRPKKRPRTDSSNNKGHGDPSAPPLDRPVLPPMLTISKESIAQLPPLAWTGTIHVLNTVEEMTQAVDEIQSSNCTHLGMDTETKPVFRRGDYNPTALIQLATETDVYLFRICKLPNYSFAPLLPILTNPNILKTGVSIHADVQDLQKMDPSFEPNGFVDCSEASFRTLHIANRGLPALTAHFMHGRLIKKQQMSNWAQEPHLSPAQIRYAATDAWVSRQVHICITKAVAVAASASKASKAAPAVASKAASTATAALPTPVKTMKCAAIPVAS